MLYFTSVKNTFVLLKKREREELKRKNKICEKQCKCYEEKNKKLEDICEELKIKVSIFVKDNEEYAAHKVRIKL